MKWILVAAVVVVADGKTRKKGKKMISQSDWERATEAIWAMHILARSFNDEDYVMVWLVNGVPDGTETLEEVRELYERNDRFDEEFESMAKFFCELVARQTATVQYPARGTDFPAHLRIDGRDVIWCGTDAHRK